MTTSSSSYARLALNTLGLASNCYGFSMVHGIFPPYIGFGGIFQFLTMIGLALATLAFTLKIVRFFVPDALCGVYKYIAHVVTPLEGLISVLYWPMVLYSKDLLMNQEVPFALPLQLDMSLHLWPAVLLWIDFLVFDVDFVRSRAHVATIYAFTLVYLAWSTYCFSQNGFWVYPFLGDFSLLGRVTFFMFSGNLCVAMYEAGAYIHKKIHKKQLPVKEEKFKQ